MKRILSVLLGIIMLFSVMTVTVFAEDTEIVLPEIMNNEWGGEEGKTVYYNGNFYATLAEALTAVYMSSPTETALVYCKPGADVGAMTHGHVADNVTIYGNGAYVSGGEQDIEVDTFKYSRANGKRDDNGAYLENDITVTVYSLNGIAAWGQRNTDNTANLVFENCKNMQRVYISAAAGTNNITLTNCTFDGNNGSNSNTSVYSNSPGTITITDCAFSNVAVPINLNNKSTGTQTVTVTDTTFTDCATKELAASTGSTTYAAPIRVLAQGGATTNLTVDTATFTYSDADDTSANGDILLGEGRYGKEGEATGTLTLSTKDTAAQVQQQTPGYYNADNTTNADKAIKTEIKETDIATADTTTNFTVACAHADTEVTGKLEASCTKEGYTGDTVCKACGETVTPGTAIEKSAHNYKDGKCTVCGGADPSVKEDTKEDKTTTEKEEKNPKTNDTVFLYVALMAASVICMMGATFSKKKVNF